MLMFQKVGGLQISSENPRTARFGNAANCGFAIFDPNLFVVYGFVIYGPNFLAGATFPLIRKTSL
jgi:hypothetical protein